MKRLAALATLILAASAINTGCSKQEQLAKSKPSPDSDTADIFDEEQPAYDEATIVKYCTEPAKRLPALREEAKRLGIDLTLGEAVETQPIPKGQNASDDYLKANAMRSKIPREEIRAWLDADLSQLDAVTRSMKKHDAYFQQVVKATQKPCLRFERDWNRLEVGEFEKYAKLKGHIEAFIARAYARSEMRDPAGALSDLATCYRISAHTTQGPSLIAALNAMQLDMLIGRAVQRLAIKWGNDLNLLERLKQTVENGQRVPDLLWIVQVEVASKFIYFSPDLVNRMDLPEGMPSLKEPPSENPSDRLMMEACEARYLEVVIAAWKKHNPAKSAYEFCDEFQRLSQLEHPKGDPSYDFVKTGESVSLASANRYISAHQAVLLTYLDIAIYKQRNGSLPKSLADAGVTRLDPCSGKPLHYRHDGDKITIYSIGSNKIDDGGKKEKNLDVVLTYPPEPTKRYAPAPTIDS